MLPAWQSALEALTGAYAPSTLSDHRRNFLTFEAWCRSRGAPCLPARPELVAAFLRDQPPTATPHHLKRRLASIRKVHLLLGLPDPTDDEDIVIALRRARRIAPRRPRQALGLTSARRDRLIVACGDDLIGLRDRALIAVGYDTLCRQSELVALRIEDLEARSAGRLSVLVRRAKNDPFGSGRTAWISARAAGLLQAWLEAAALQDGPMLRGVRAGRVATTPLGGSSVGPILRRRARQAGLPEEEACHLSGHSLRVGAAQDLMASGHDLGIIMRAGGWASRAIVARYVEQVDPGLWDRRAP